MRWRRWADLSRVERVDVYTRGSLHLLLWAFAVSLMVGSVLPHRAGLASGAAVAVVAGALVVTALGSRAMSAVIDLHPAARPLPWGRLAPLLLAATAYVAALAPLTDDEVRAAVVVIAVVNLSGAFGGVPDPRAATAVVLGCGALAGLGTVDATAALGGAGVAAFVVFTVRASLWVLAVVAELDDARTAQTRLAVAEERLRFSRDVHDVLGRRLSTIAVQAELAATLAERGDDRAPARMLEVRAIAHDALAEARELARGYRPTDLATELEGARSLLRSAGIEAAVEVDVVPRGWHEAAGWVVREAVTNVLRHSAARSVTIAYAEESLRVTNDGVTAAPAGEGSGLAGLRERLGALGATLDVLVADGSWTVTAGLPGAGPLTAATAGREATR